MIYHPTTFLEAYHRRVPSRPVYDVPPVVVRRRSSIVTRARLRLRRLEPASQRTHVAGPGRQAGPASPYS